MVKKRKEDGGIEGGQEEGTQHEEDKGKVGQQEEKRKEERSRRSRPSARSRSTSSVRRSGRRGSRERETDKRYKTPEKKTQTKEVVSIMSTATTIAKSLMGFNSEEGGKAVTTIKIKKEMANENERYSGDRKGKNTEEAIVIDDQDKEEDTNTTPGKRKKQETAKTLNKSSGKDKKKQKQQTLKLTPKRIVMERESKQTENQETKVYQAATPKEKQKDQTEPTAQNEQKETSRNETPKKPVNNNTDNTPQTTNESRKAKRNENENEDEGENPKEARQNESKQATKKSKEDTEQKTNKEANNKNNENNNEDKEDIRPTRENEASGEKRNPNPSPMKANQQVMNPYKTTNNERNSPTSKRSQEVSYAAATQQTQTNLITQEKKRSKHSRRYEVAFNIEKNATETTEQEIAHFREVLSNILRRAKKVDKKAMINTWKEGSTMRTIETERDLPFTIADYKMYLTHPYPEKKLQNGKNSAWRINLTYSIPPELFIHYWERSKRELQEIPYNSLKDAPMQTERYYNCGSLINSSDGQETKQLVEQLQKEMKIPINCSFRTAPLDRQASEEMWKNAYAEKRKGNGSVFTHAPLSLNVYTNTAENARRVAKYMLTKYGHQEQGQYPRLPDGSRMRFIPASRFLDMAGRDTAKAIFKNQIRFNSDNIRYRLPINDIYKKFKQHGDRTMMELLLDLQCKEKQNEPYFRHIVRMWTKNPSEKNYQVSVHTQMQEEASAIIHKLAETLRQEYDEEVANEVESTDEIEDMNMKGTMSMSTTTMSLDTNDRYMNGSARFIIEGMEALNTNDNKETLTEKKLKEDDNFTMEVDSEGTDNTLETTRTMAVTESKTVWQTSIRQGHPATTNKEQETPKSRAGETNEWHRVGGKTAEEELRKLSTKIKEPDPDGQRGREP